MRFAEFRLTACFAALATGAACAHAPPESERADGSAVVESNSRGVVTAAQARFNGAWLVDDGVDRLLTEDGKIPPLLPAARVVYEEHLRRRAAGDVSFDTSTWCSSPGLPRLMLIDYPFEILVRPDVVAFHYEWNRWGRLVEMNIDELEVLYPSPIGVSLGHWEGETLVIDTRGVIDTALLDTAGLPHSEDMVLTERLRVLPDGRLENRLTVDDPATYAAPWTARVVYQPQFSTTIDEDVCLDRIRAGEPAVRSQLAGGR